MQKIPETVESVVVRFVGDSGDGMQLTGTQFTETAALAGNDVATFPDYPAEIRAPAGTVAGVSGFQIQFSSNEVFTPGDAPDLLVAMNAAALKVNLSDVKRGGTLILNTGGFDKRSLDKAGYKSDPQTDGSLSGYRVIAMDITGQTMKCVEGTSLSRKLADRSKNFYALGVVYWMFGRSLDHTVQWIEQKFAKKSAEVADVNIRALKAGYAFGETAEIAPSPIIVPAAKVAPGKYKNLSGNEATAMALVTAAERADLPLFLGSYPITPASDILHFLSMQRHLGVMTFQAEDEIAAIASAIGASYGGSLAVTTSSGPGIALKSEGMSLAIMYELPLLIIDVQRGGPSTGLPTKTEQSDLMMALYGRHGECPIPIIAALSPADCFETVLEATRIAIKYMTPVMILTDGYIANGVEPFKIPDLDTIAKIPVTFRTNPEGFFPYMRDENLARPWALPGTPGLEHRIGGLEKDKLTGAVSYDNENHEYMVNMRAAKVAKVAESYAPVDVYGDASGEMLVLGWGGTYGAIRGAVRSLRARGTMVSHLHLRHMNPLPSDLGEVLSRFKRVLIPELNLGQLATVLRAKYGIPFESYCKVQGKPFKESEIIEAVVTRLESSNEKPAAHHAHRPVEANA